MNVKSIAVAFVCVLCAVEAFAIADSAKFKFRKGINLSRLEGWMTTSAGYLGYESTYSTLKEKGFDHIRLPVYLRSYYDSSSQSLKSNMSVIDGILDKCEAAGLYVFLDFHGWSGINTSDASQKAEFLKIWELVAARYKDRSDYVIYELINEPHDTEGGNLDAANLNAIQAEVMPLIRKSDPNRLVLLATAEWNGPWTLSSLTIPENSGRIGVVCHTYAPMGFTHQGCTWGGFPTDLVRFSSADKTSTGTADLDNAFMWIDDFQEKTGIPVVMNEFGVNKQNSQAYDSDVLDWTTYVAHNCESNGIAWTWWEYNQGFGAYYNYQWRAPVMDGLFPSEPAGNSYGSSFDAADYAKKLTISFPGYSGASALSDFPVLVRLSTAISGFSYADFKRTGGDDLRFTDSSGNLIPHEVDTWNSNGVSTVWVKVPALTSTTTIKAYYGCTLPVAVDSSKVWSNGYVGVWHLGEGGLPLKESSLESTDFTKQNGSGIKYAQTGMVGGSVDFGATGNGRMLTAMDCDAMDGFSNCTVEAWTYQTTNTTAAILSKRYSSSRNLSYFLYHNGSKTQFNVAATDSTSGSSAQIAPALNTWTHQAYTFAVGTIKGYKDGAKVGSDKSVSFSKINASDGYLHLGNFNRSGAWNADTRNFPGKIDEVRISSVERSADWLKATHDTVANAGFASYAMGGEAPAEPDRILYVDVAAGATNTLDAALVTEYITNIVKRGSGWLVASALDSYEGSFTIEGGVFSVGVKNGAGKDKYANEIYVGDGASLEFTGTVGNILDNKKVVLEGNPAAGAVGKFISNGRWVTIGSGMSFTLRSDAVFAACGGQRMIFTGEDFDLGGHTMTVKNAGGSQANLNNSTLRNGGRLVVGRGMTILHEGGTLKFETPSSGSPSVTLEDNAVLNLKVYVSASGWTLFATNSNTTITANAARKPIDVSTAGWDGRMVLGGSTKLASYAGTSQTVSNTVFNVKGAVSGSGTLAVGPGWLNLHNADNTYSGAVTVTGESASTAVAPILPGGGGIGLWNGAAWFTNASSVTFNDSARLAFMDETACSVGSNVVFAGGEGDVQSVSGGVHTARSTMAGFTKTGAGTLLIDSPVSVTGLADIQAGTLKVAYRVDVAAQDQASLLAPLPQLPNLKFAFGTRLDLSDNVGFVFTDIQGSPSVTNSGVFGIAGKWTLSAPGEVLKVQGQNAAFGEQSAAGVMGFVSGSTFDLADEAAFRTAVEAAGADGLLVAEANWVMDPSQSADVGMPLAMPAAVEGLSAGWSMVRSSGGTKVYLRYSGASASGYAAWISEKGITGQPGEKTNGIENGVRYAFDIAPETAEIGDPVIKVVMDVAGNPSVEVRELAEGRSDVTVGILATEDLLDWSSAVLIPMKKFSSDGLWRPTASEGGSYEFPSRMFYRYSIEIQ